MNKIDTVHDLREFNRFYFTNMGFMNKNYLESEYSIAEARILFEINQNHSCTQSNLISLLNIDKGYLSRLIKRLEQKELIQREVSQSDRRSSFLFLTKKGKDVITDLIHKSDDQISDMIDSLDEEQCEQISKSVNQIIQILSKK